MAITTPAGTSRRNFIRLTGTLGVAAGLAASVAACGRGGKAAKKVDDITYEKVYVTAPWRVTTTARRQSVVREGRGPSLIRL